MESFVGGFVIVVKICQGEELCAIYSNPTIVFKSLVSISPIF
jgi:hypothetical protein